MHRSGILEHSFVNKAYQTLSLLYLWTRTYIIYHAVVFSFTCIHYSWYKRFKKRIQSSQLTAYMFIVVDDLHFVGYFNVNWFISHCHFFFHFSTIVGLECLPCFLWILHNMFYIIFSLQLYISKQYCSI